MKIYYKIIELGKDGEFQTLFHGINGTKKLAVGKWIKAVKKERVRDGDGENWYTAGIHIIDGYEDTVKYLRRFKRKDRAVVLCHAKGLRRKTQSKCAVYLADQIKILSDKCITLDELK